MTRSYILWGMGRDVRRWIRRAYASPFFWYGLILILFLVIFIYHLNSRPSGLNAAEASARNNLSLKAILDNPLNAPHRLIEHLLNSAGLKGVFGWRLSSVLFGVLFGVSFYTLAKNLFGKLIGFFATTIFITTPLFLITARQASSEIMFFSVVAIMAAYTWLLRTKTHAEIAFLLLMIAAGVLVYTPGIVWWLIGSLIISRKKITEAMSNISAEIIAAGVLLLLVLLVPLGMAGAKDLNILKDLALVPIHFNFVATLKNIGWMISALFIKTPAHTDLIIQRLPILNIIETAFLIFGSYAMWTVAKSKLFALGMSLVFGVIAAAVTDNLYLLAIGLPAVMVLVAAGLRYLYIEWRSIFPRNPVAKYLAFLFMGAVIIVQLLFGLRYSLVAWPNTVATKSVYVLK